MARAVASALRASFGASTAAYHAARVCVPVRSLLTTTPAAAAAAAAAAAPSLKAEFDRVCAAVGPSIATSGTNDQKLQAYALYKQATGGDVAGARPGMMDFVARAKYDAHAKLKGMSGEAAMKEYIATFGAGGAGGGAGGDDHDLPAAARDKFQPKGAYLPVRSTPMLPPGSFDGKVAFVTGGGTGLGKAMATTLSSLGATVAIASRKKEVVEGTAAEISKATGKRVLAYSMDVREPEAIAATLNALEADAGVPDIVVNNAAGNFISPFERLSPNAWKSITDIVLNGTAYVTMDAGKRMIKRGKGGVFLAITTVYAETGSGYVVPSAAAKAGVAALTKSLSSEWGRYGIRFVGIAPGPIETKGAFTRLDPSGQFKDIMTERLPARRLGEPAELANLASYLVSDYASWLSGEIVTLDGGEAASLAGEFNALRTVTDDQWTALEGMIRKTNKKA